MYYKISNKKICSRIKNFVMGNKWQKNENFKRKILYENTNTLKLPSGAIPESPQNTLIEASTSSYQSVVPPKLQFSRQWWSAGTTENLPSLLSIVVRPMWSIIIYPNRHFSIKWTSESIFILPRIWCKKISRENNLEKKFGLACSLELSCNNCYWSSSLYSSNWEYSRNWE